MGQLRRQSGRMGRTVRIYRWIVFLLAAGYCLRMIFFSSYEQFAGPFRFLTVWALFCSFFAASRMMALIEGRSTRRWDGFVSMTAVANAMVVYLYWSLFFNDPRSVTSDGQLGVWWLEGYLHALGPLLQWIDALFIHRSFRRPGAALGWLVGLIGTYVLWIEFVVQPLATAPRGTVTNGLPYPFLNSLLPGDRIATYASYVVAAVLLLIVFSALAWAVRRFLPQAGRPARAGNPGSAG